MKVSNVMHSAVRVMERKQAHRLPVIDHNKQILGVLGLGEITAQMAPRLRAETLPALSTHRS